MITNLRTRRKRQWETALGEHFLKLYGEWREVIRDAPLAGHVHEHLATGRWCVPFSSKLPQWLMP